MLDIIAVLLIVFLALRGKSTGFVKTVLGMFSVIVCAIVTVAVFDYISDAGVIVSLEQRLFSQLDSRWLPMVGYLSSIVVATAVFVLVRFAYKIAVDMISFVVPGFLDSALGFLFGLLQGGAFVLLVLGIIFLVSGNLPEVTEKIDETVVLKQLYYNNPLLLLLK